jgi:hypothetical protein
MTYKQKIKRKGRLVEHHTIMVINRKTGKVEKLIGNKKYLSIKEALKSSPNKLKKRGIIILK